MDDELPPTRWEQASPSDRGYAKRFRQLVAEGADITGEARLADALVPRGARILDAGSGMGRIGAALQDAGHRVWAVEKDPELVALSHELHPDLPVIASDLLALSPALLEDAGAPATYDLLVLVGNVLVLGAEGGEVRMLRTLGALLAPQGRILVGFHLEGGPVRRRRYTHPEFAEDVAAAGLRVQHVFGGYDLAPADEEYVVALLIR
ncbi:MAG: class I SAM-dependent methyltransferase [Marmoricola sp.]